MCDYASSQLSHLRSHLIRHTGDKPNECNQCNYDKMSYKDLTHLSKNASIRSQLSSKYIQIYGLGVTDPCSQILDRLVSLTPGGLVLHLVRLRVCHHQNHVGGSVAQNLATARLAEFQVTL